MQQVAAPKTLYERPLNRFVADFVGTNNFIAGVCKERAGEDVLVDTALGPLRARPSAAVPAGGRCVLAIRPENLSLDGAGGNAVDGRVRLSAYLGSILRYDVDTPSGLILKVDVRDPWHHEVLPPGRPVRVGFPPSVALMLPDD